MSESGLNTEWLLSRVPLAEDLARGIHGGSYPDAILILSSVISGIASHLWPGDRIDRVRFVELWARYSDPALRPNNVSVPLLAQHFATNGDHASAKSIRSHSATLRKVPPGWMDQVTVTGESVDLSENEVSKSVSGIEPELIRRYTYGNLFYRHFRSGYVHRYGADPLVDQNNMGGPQADVVYSCYSEPPHRRVHFNPSWIGSIVKSVVSSADKVFDQRPLSKPEKWWALGG